jgi:hypothetical protein
MTGCVHYAFLQSLDCSICNSPVSLETCNTDERGSPVHEECYVRKTISRLRTDNGVHVGENWPNSLLMRFRVKSA